jgi:hypothetical protein
MFHRRARTSLALLLGLFGPVALVVFAGCSALLGDFTLVSSGPADASSGADGSSDGGTDATVDDASSADVGTAEGDTGPGGDQPDAGDAGCPATFLACNGGCVPNDPKNCGKCGHDCTKLPHVTGAVGCATGTCELDAGSCAAGYGICATNPDLGCDTNIGQSSHCGTCATTCTGGTPDCAPTNDAGTKFACSSGCTTGLSLCGSSCVNELNDGANCGGCGTACSAGQECSGGRCVCDVNSCPNGCCDTLGNCQAAPSCGSAGVACTSGCPVAVPESKSLALWLVGEDYSYASGTRAWLDRSGHHADCACPSCPGGLTVNGHPDVAFGGAHYFTISDPSADLQSAAQSWTFFIVAKPNVNASAYNQLFALYDSAGEYVKFQRNNTNNDIAFQIIPGNGTTNFITTQPAANAWAGNWERLYATVDANGNATMYAYNNTLGVSAGSTGAIGAPSASDFALSYLGTAPASPGTSDYWGEIAEIIVFKSAPLSAATVNAVEGYLTARYGF